jgi:hypothetical protein
MIGHLVYILPAYTTTLSIDLPLNRLFCAYSYYARSISKYPFNSNSLRLTTYIYCQYRRKEKKQAQRQSPRQPPQQSPQQPY